MSYYGPYDYFPVHSRYGPPDLRPPELRDLRMLPQDLHPVDIPHHEDAWGYGPPPPAPPPMYPPHHPTPPPPHYTAFDPIPYEAPIVVPDRPSSNIGNSFAIPKGSRNAMNRAAPAAETPSIVGANGSRTHSAKLNAQSVGATIAAPRKPAKGATTRPPPLKIKCERKDSPSGSTSPTARSGSSSATAPDSCASPVPNVIPAQYLVAPPTWKRMFETARARDPEEVGVAAPVVELASQMLNKRCMQLVAGDPPRRRFHMVVDSSILKKGVLSARSNEAMTVALYLFQLSKGVTNNGELVSTETMLCKMRIFVGDTRLLPAAGMSNGVQINLLPALTREIFEQKNVAIVIESRPEDFASGLAMICLRRLESPVMGHPRPGVAVPSLLRRHSAPVRPAFPLVTPPAASTGRANSALSTSSPAPASSSESLKRRSSEVEMPSDEEEIQVGDQIVSLVCPISLKRIIVPGKGRSCRHVQCFDLETFVKLSRLNCKWKCGICSDTIEKNDLIVSEPFLHLLAAYPESEKCIMRADGTHARYAKSSMPRKKARLSGDQPSRTTEVVDLCDDDEEPVANETTAKPDDQSSVHSQQSQITEVARGQSPREATPPQAAQHFPVVTKRFTEEQARYRFPPRSASVESPREESPLFWEDRQGIKKRTTSPSPISQTEREERIQRIFQAAAASAATCEPKDDTLSLPRSVGGERACRVAARNCTHNQQDADASIDSHVAAPLC